MNPRQLQQMMKQMGMQQTEIAAEQVIIRTKDKDIVIDNPQVSKVTMMGQQTWQVVGEAKEVKRSFEYTPSADDIETVISQTGKSKEQAAAALKETQGDIAEAIVKLQ